MLAPGTEAPGKYALEFFIFIDNLNAMFKIGLPILTSRGKVAVDRHLVWRRHGPICATRS
jgi:hypothetical protein